MHSQEGQEIGALYGFTYSMRFNVDGQAVACSPDQQFRVVGVDHRLSERGFQQRSRSSRKRSPNFVDNSGDNLLDEPREAHGNKVTCNLPNL